MTIIASRAAAAIENARLYGDLQATFQQTIHGLASAIDKMDRYTAGHSERVAEYAVYLARRLGLSERQIEIVRQSALMHDIGKIGCVLKLNKPGKLTDDEYEAFKQHPVYGRDILSPITFLHPLAPHALRRRVTGLLRRKPRTRFNYWPRQLRRWLEEAGFRPLALGAERKWLREFWIGAYTRTAAPDHRT